MNAVIDRTLVAVAAGIGHILPWEAIKTELLTHRTVIGSREANTCVPGCESYLRSAV